MRLAGSLNSEGWRCDSWQAASHASLSDAVSPNCARAFSLLAAQNTSSRLRRSRLLKTLTVSTLKVALKHVSNYTLATIGALTWSGLPRETYHQSTCSRQRRRTWPMPVGRPTRHSHCMASKRCMPLAVFLRRRTTAFTLDGMGARLELGVQSMNIARSWPFAAFSWSARSPSQIAM